MLFSGLQPAAAIANAVSNTVAAIDNRRDTAVCKEGIRPCDIFEAMSFG
jgi:hypothetical protein